MITDYDIDPGLGGDDQVGLFVRGEEQAANQLRYTLYREGFRAVKYMLSHRPGFRFFTYVTLPQSGPHSTNAETRLETICQDHQDDKADASSGVPDYEKWKAVFDNYVETYRRRSTSREDTSLPATFDKKHAYTLIQTGHHEEAERYLQSFMDEDPPLLPAYLIYLYQEWHRPEDVIASYEQFASHFQEGDVDRRVIEWIVSAYLRAPSPDPERALFVLNDYLPEFQRQGTAETLLTLRAQARALQGQLPQTTADLRRYLAQTESDVLTDQLDDLLDVITGLAEDTTTINGLLNRLADQIAQSHQWRIWLAQANVARRNRDLDTALSYLQKILDIAPSTLSKVELASIELSIANIHLERDNTSVAAQMLRKVPHQDLIADEQRVFWGLYGRALLSSDKEAAQAALRNAYEMGSTQSEVLRPLARLAYRSGNLALAQDIYEVLYESGFEPTLQDNLHTGILAWLDGDLDTAVHELNQLVDIPIDRLPADTATLAYEALLDSLETSDASGEKVINGYSAWLDWLVAQDDQEALFSTVKRITQSDLDGADIFTLLEATEPLLAKDEESKNYLGQTYVNLLCREIDMAIRQKRPLPDYTNDLRRALFALDRQQFDFVQEFLQDEITRARQADIETELAEELETESTLDLSDKWVAVVGGYAPVRRRVRERLEQEYQLGHFTEAPPSWEAHINQKRVAEAVIGADLIVVVHRCIKHDGTDALKAAIEGTEEKERIRYAAGKGQSSILRTVTERFKQE